MNVVKKAALIFLLLIGTHLFFTSSSLSAAFQGKPIENANASKECLELPSNGIYNVNREGNKLCLTMIVKNEAKIIERCLNTVKDIVDYISICDTGSTDNTVEIIENFMEKTGIPGKVHRHEWKNFGYNRSLSAEAAQEWLSKQGCPLKNTYLLLIDADMMLQVGADFTKSSLKEDSYKLCQKSNTLSYFNTRLIRASLPWDCVGVTHEYWACKFPCDDGRLDTLIIDDRNDGGCKSDKFERDVRMLTQGLKDEPGNSRYVFYLATSYHCLREYDTAIKWYLARIAMGGWYEEVWYCKYMIGTCYEAMEEWEQALSYYLDAHRYNPERAESLQLISKHYRMNKDYEMAYFFAKKGSLVPYPANQVLFVSYPVYEYLFDEDLSICAYYAGFKDEGSAAVNRLLLKRDIPEYIKKQACNNVSYYVEPLKDADFKPEPLVAERSEVKVDNGLTEKFVKALEQNGKYDFSRISATIPPVEFDNVYLAIVKETVGDKPSSVHRFISFDRDFNVAKVSKPFVFMEQGNESCSAITLDSSKEKVGIAIINNEKKSYIGFLNFVAVRNLLE
ncbi:MAG TPA: glycosyltransferase [Parachlamydiaceae bacterium]|nr:glycosyltransferase [Parachlamydiaceae bacterium]